MKKEKILNLISLSFLIINLLLLIWFIFIGYENEFHSDSAAKVLLAREIYDTRNFFPKDWNYANGDLFIIFGQLFIIPLLAFMPAGFLTHAISGSIFSVLILIGVWLITTITEMALYKRIAIVAIFAGGLSGVMTENLYGQISYGVILLFCLFIIYFCIKYINTNGKKRIGFGLGIFLLIFFSCWSNPTRALIYYIIPLVGTSILMFFSNEKKNKHSYIKLIIILSIGSVVGIIFNQIPINNVSNVIGASDGKWLDIESIFDKLFFMAKGLYSQLGGLPVSGENLFEPRALYSGLRFFIATLVIVLIPISLYKATTSNNINLQILGFYSFILLVISIFIYLSTSIPDVSDPIQSSRYLVPGVAICFLLLLLTEIDFNNRSPLLESSILIIYIIFLTCGYSTYIKTGLTYKELGQEGQLDEERKNLINLLETNNLFYGYSTYWNAGAVSVISNETIKVRPIQIERGIPIPFRHLSSNSWYRSEFWKDQTFLLLKKEEAKNLNWDVLKSYKVIPKNIINYKEYIIFVFEGNIANTLPNWDSMVSNPIFIPVTKLSKHNIGKIFSEINDSTYILKSNIAEVGVLHFGPYVKLEPGRYTVIFDVHISDSDVDSIKLDVYSHLPNQEIFGEILLKNNNQSKTINFTLDRPKIIEFRVFALGGAEITYKGIMIHRRNH